MRVFPVFVEKYMHFAYDIKILKKSIIKRVHRSLNIRLTCYRNWSNNFKFKN